MKIVRVFSGDDGESHFEDVSPEEMAEIVNRVGAGDITLGLRTSPSFSDYHNAPRRQYVVNLKGSVEIETGSGDRRVLGAGSILLAEDTTGQGHISRSVGNEERQSLFITLD